ncbi:hypothetical protein RJ639_032292 [Escallonia herrerae]|uniref:Zinc finger, CCHC-type n=1 Tax=Escallonia herrerae TaxID=1293975 RepID=A0AA88WWS2_9ASTE|nr:hypothetical protein RJ639_032292 [Escallonia herrerae]
MHFLLVKVKVYYVIVNPRPPEPGENEEESVAKTRERLRWDRDDEICRGHILNGMSNMLFDAYHTVKTAKELWNQLERRYITEDATSKRFIVSKFFDYKMVDGRSVMEQFNEIKSILDRYSHHKLALDEFIVVISIIDKLPPSWKNFRNSLKHRKEDINLDELGTHLRIEEDLCKEEKFQSLPKQVEQKEGQRDVEENHENEVEPRRSKQMRIVKTYGPDFYMYLVEGTRTSPQICRRPIVNSSRRRDAISVDPDRPSTDHCRSSVDSRCSSRSSTPSTTAVSLRQSTAAVHAVCHGTPPGSPFLGLDTVKDSVYMQP